MYIGLERFLVFATLAADDLYLAATSGAHVHCHAEIAHKRLDVATMSVEPVQ